jgi:hypothetical protein
MGYDPNVYSLILDPTRNQVVSKKGEDTAMRSQDREVAMVIRNLAATVVQEMTRVVLVEKKDEEGVKEGVVEKVIEMVARVEDHNKIEKIRR